MEKTQPWHEEPENPQHDGEQHDHDSSTPDPLVHRNERDRGAQDDQHDDDDGNGLDRHSRHYAHSATYSPEDDKIRIYPGYRLDKETEYAAVKAAGYQWAPKQECFYAVWSPGREDLAIEMAGEIDDEAKSLADRAEERAARFDGYQANRRRDSASAQAAVHAITDGIPLGQPILVGHHSEKHARRDQERIENGMRKAVKMWDTAEYWKYRAAGALSHALYKERPGVRARRIKTLEAEQRKQQRGRAVDVRWIAAWETAHDDSTTKIRHHDGTASMFKDRAVFLANESHRYELWKALDAGTMEPERAQAGQLITLRANVDRADRWIAHLEHRIGYERALLEEAGESHRLEKPKRRELAPLLNYREPAGFDIENRWSRGEIIHYPQIDMTRAQYAAVHDDYKGTRIVDGNHRIRTIMQRSSLFAVFITDAGTHTRPAPKKTTCSDCGVELDPGIRCGCPDEDPEPEEPKRLGSDPIVSGPEPEPEPAAADPIAGMRASLKAGIKVVSAPQLFPTSPQLAADVVRRALILDGQTVLEPSAGTGRLLDAMNGIDVDVTAIEISWALCTALNQRPRIKVHCADFLDATPETIGTFDRIVMNPPFTKGADIKHINHARQFLKPGGRLVSICAAGPKQRAAFEDEADTWIDLPAGSFAAEGTNVSTAIVIFDAPTPVRAGSAPAIAPMENAPQQKGLFD